MSAPDTPATQKLAPSAAPGYAEFEENRIKHLELIQAVISRLGNDGFLIKGTTVTVTAAFLGFAVDREEGALAFVSLAPIAAFYGLDAYFLRSERLFRALYDAVRQGDGPPAFFMAATDPEFADAQEEDIRSWRKTLGRRVLQLYYGGLALAAILVGALVSA